MDDAEKKNRAAFALIVGDGDEGEEFVEVVLNASLSALRFGMFWRPGAFGPRKLEVLDDPHRVLNPNHNYRPVCRRTTKIQSLHNSQG